MCVTSSVNANRRRVFVDAENPKRRVSLEEMDLKWETVVDKLKLFEEKRTALLDGANFNWGRQWWGTAENGGSKPYSAGAACMHACGAWGEC